MPFYIFSFSTAPGFAHKLANFFHHERGLPLRSSPSLYLEKQALSAMVTKEKFRRAKDQKGTMGLSKKSFFWEKNIKFFVIQLAQVQNWHIPFNAIPTPGGKLSPIKIDLILSPVFKFLFNLLLITILPPSIAVPKVCGA